MKYLNWAKLKFSVLQCTVLVANCRDVDCDLACVRNRDTGFVILAIQYYFAM